MNLPHDGMLVDLNSAVSSSTVFHNLLQRQRDLQGACITSENLQTPNEANTVVVGNMFTVQSHNDPLTMQTMEICANPIESLMKVQIYTKIGDFKGVENDPTQWTKIVDTSIVPAREGRGTIIPTDEFISFTMNPNEVRAFFISAQTSDLRYRRADDFAIGQTFVSDGYLSVNVGVGLADPGFGSRVFPSRSFSGIFHYTHLADCDAPNSKTVLTYTFYGTPKAKVSSKSEVADEINRRVGDAVQDILKSDMSALSTEHTIGLDDIETYTVVFSQGKCPVKKWHSCLSVESKITLSHRNTITGGQLQYLLLQQVPEVTTRIQKGSLHVVYAGYQPVQTSIFLAFKGVPAGVSMDKEQKLFLEQVTTDYLEEQTVGVTNVNVIGTKITNQRGPDFDERSLRGLENGTVSDGWIELSIDVLAMMIPPYVGSSEFVNVVDDALRYDRKGYIEDIITGRHRPGSQVEGERGKFFLGINNVNTRIPGKGYSASSGTSYSGVGETSSETLILGMSKMNFVVVCVGLVIAALGWLWYASVRKSRKDDNIDSKGDPLLEPIGQSSKRNTFSSFSRKSSSKSKDFVFGDDLPTTEYLDSPLIIDDKTSHLRSSSGRVLLGNQHVPASGGPETTYDVPLKGSTDTFSKRTRSEKLLDRSSKGQEDLDSASSSRSMKKSGTSRSHDDEEPQNHSSSSRSSSRSVSEHSTSSRGSHRGSSSSVQSTQSSSTEPHSNTKSSSGRSTLSSSHKRGSGTGSSRSMNSSQSSHRRDGMSAPSGSGKSMSSSSENSSARSSSSALKRTERNESEKSSRGSRSGESSTRSTRSAMHGASRPGDASARSTRSSSSKMQRRGSATSLSSTSSRSTARSQFQK